MHVILETTDVHHRPLLIAVCGSEVTQREHGKGTAKVTRHATREEAVASADKAIARRMKSGKWRVAGRTDSDHYLAGIAKMKRLAADVKKAPEVTVHQARVMAWGAARFATLEGKPGATLPGYRDFLLTTTAVGLHLHIAVGDAHQDLRFGFGSLGRDGEVPLTARIDPRGHVLVGRINDLEWWLDPETGKVTGEAGAHDSFQAYFDAELRELRQYIYDAGAALGVSLSIF